MSDWRQVPLAEVANRVTTKNVNGANENVLTVSAEHGLIAQESFFTKKVASKDTSGYYVVQSGQFVYNKSTSKSAMYGTVARNLNDEPGVVSPLYFVFEVKDGAALPEYLELALNSDQFFGSLAGMLREGARSHGALNVRLKEFYAATVVLPPEPIQRRIVEVIGATNDQITALDVEAERLLRVRNAVLENMLSQGGEEWLSVPLSEAGVLTRGRRFVKNDYSEAGLGCIHYGQIYTDYGASAKRTFTHLPESFRGSMRLAQCGDVVIAGTSENVEDVGKAVAWLGNDEVAVHDDCFIFRHNLDPMFVSYFFASPIFQHQKRQFTSVTKVVRISAANLGKIIIPAPPREEQERISGIASAIDAQISDLRQEAEHLRQMRIALTSGLLNRTIDIAPA